jgi:PEP-CTERM motif
MRIPLPKWAVVATLAASTLIARADSFTFFITTGSTSTTPGSSFVVNGTLTGTPSATVPNAFDVTGITGSGQGYTFTGVVPLGAEPTITYNNLLYPNNPNALVDSAGILLDLTSPIGVSLAHVYDNNGYHVDVFDPNDPGDITPFVIQSFVITPVATSATPEPSTFLLIGTGAIGIFGGLRRRCFRP